MCLYIFSCLSAVCCFLLFQSFQVLIYETKNSMGNGEDERTSCASPMDEKQLSETKLAMDHLVLL